MGFNRESTRDFFERESEWAGYKHEILRKYLRVWVSKLQSLGRNLAFIDTCAGPGRYEDGKEGSPLLAAKMNDVSPLKDRRSKLVVYAVEGDPEAYSHLETNLALWRKRGVARVFNDPFEDILPRLMKDARGGPTLVFVDPFRLIDVDPRKLEPILAEEQQWPTELLFRVDAGVLARMTGFLRKKEDKSERELKLERSMRRRLLHLGIDEGELERYEEPSGSEPGTRPEQLLASFLGTFEERFAYVAPIPVRSDYYAAPRYHLVHCTDNAHGAAKMNDIVSTTDDALFEDTEVKKAEGQLLLFEPQRPRRASPADARPVIRSLLEKAAGKRMKFIELCAELAQVFGPDLREKHHRAAVKAMRKERYVEVEEEGTAVNENSWIRLRISESRTLDEPRQETRPTSSRPADARRPSGSGRQPA